MAVFLARPFGKQAPVPRGTRVLGNAREGVVPMLYLVLLAPVAALGLVVSMAAVERWQQRGSQRQPH
jgi:hypothetical protein